MELMFLCNHSSGNAIYSHWFQAVDIASGADNASMFFLLAVSFNSGNVLIRMHIIIIILNTRSIALCEEETLHS